MPTVRAVRFRRAPSAPRRPLSVHVYRYIPLANLVFYQWHLRMWTGGAWSGGVYVGGCPDSAGQELVYYGPDKDYIYTGEDVSDLIGGVNPIQMALGCVDMCKCGTSSGQLAATPTSAVDRQLPPVPVQDCRSAVDVS